MSAPTVEIGTALPQWVLPVTPTLIVSTALATRDFQDVHHDRDLAVERGSKDIFLNILTSTGLAQRYVTDWLGPRALIRAIGIRLGAPAYPGDALTFTGEVTDRTTADNGEERFAISVRATNSLGAHLSGTVTVALAEET